LDELLQQRGGEPFETADKDEEEAAAIGAALHLLSGRGPSVADPARSARQERHPASPGGRVGWKARARAEALRP
jgi:hypothetical protein